MSKKLIFRPAFYIIDRADLVSGVNTWIQNLSLELKQLGHEPLLLIKPGSDSDVAIKNFCTSNGIKYVLLRRRFGFSQAYLKEIANLLVKNQVNFWLPGYFDIGYYLTSYLSQFNIKTITVLHSDDDRYRKYFEEFILSDGPNRSHGVVSVSQFLDSWSADNAHNVPRQVIGYGVNVPAQAKNYSSSPTLKLVYCGRLVQEQKRFKEVFKSFKLAVDAYPSVHGSFIGDGELKNWLIKEIEKTGCERLSYAGSFPNAEIQEQLKNYDVVVLLSDFEGLPLILLEAMAAGLTVITLEMKSGVSELLRHKENGLIVKDRGQDFIDSIRYLIQNPNELFTMGIEAREDIAKKFSTKVSALKWIEFFTSISETPKTLTNQQKLEVELPWRFRTTIIQSLMVRFIMSTWPKKASSHNLDRVIFMILHPLKLPVIAFRKIFRN